MNKLTDYRAILNELLNVPVYSMNHFWRVSPYKTVKEINKSRKVERVAYLDLGLTWYYLAGYSTDECVKYFEKGSHSTAIHALRKVIDCLENPKRNPILYEAIKNIKIAAKEEPYHTDDLWETHLMCNVYLENNFKNNFEKWKNN